MNVHRRLAALLFADIVDFSGLSARDEAAALELVPVFQSVTREVVRRYGGRIVKFLGDGVLAEFPSTGNAIGAASVLLDTLLREAEHSGLPRAELRIGVHVGDVAISEDGDVYGDGVNVTARLCEEAEPGSILVSEDVHRHLKQRSQFEFSPPAGCELQGVGRVETYSVRVLAPVEPDLEDASPRRSARLPRMRSRTARLASGAGLVVLLITAWVTRGTWTSWISAESAESATLDPSRLAVLYFHDLSEDGDLKHLAAGFTESLIQELGRIEGLRVVSQHGVEPYEGSAISIDSVARALEAGTIIEGALSRSGDSLSVQVQLVDAVSGNQFADFSEVRPWNEMFSLQDHITAEVSTALRQRLGREIVLEARRRATNSVEAWELVQRAERMSEQALLASDASDVRELMWSSADSLLRLSAELDPHWTEPSLSRARLALEVGTEESLARGLEAVERVFTRHRDDAEGFIVRGALRTSLARQAGDSTRAAHLLDAAERDLRTAVANDPTSATAWITLADLLYNDRWELSEAREAARRAYEEDVFLLEEDHFKWLCEISIQLRDYEQAERWCAEGRRRFPNDVYLMMSDLTRLASTGVDPQPEVGWSLARSIGRQPFPEFNTPAAKMYVAAILVRAGDPDSAASVALDARRAAPLEVVPFLDYLEAYVRLLGDDRLASIRLLRSFLTAMPEYRATVARDHWFDELRGDDRFEALVDRVHLPIFCRILCEVPE